jgi:hypothetical protein
MATSRLNPGVPLPQTFYQHPPPGTGGGSFFGPGEGVKPPYIQGGLKGTQGSSAGPGGNPGNPQSLGGSNWGI